MELNLGLRIGLGRARIGVKANPLLPPLLEETNLADMGLSSTNIDERLIYLYSIGTTGQIIKIYGNDPRTSASDEAYAGLTTAPLNNYIIEDTP